MEQNVSVWKANLTNGVILASISIVYSLIMYFLDLYLNKVQGFIFLPVLAVITFLLLKSYRDNFLHGQITYGQSFGAGMVIYLYYAIFMAVFTYILYAIIDPGLVTKQLAMAEEIMVKRGAPEAAIEAGMSIQKKIMKPEILAPLSIFGTMLSGLIISLIVSVFVRKEGNPLIDTPEN